MIETEIISKIKNQKTCFFAIRLNAKIRANALKKSPRSWKKNRFCTGIKSGVNSSFMTNDFIKNNKTKPIPKIGIVDL